MSFTTYRTHKVFDLFPVLSEMPSSDIAQKTSEFGTIGHTKAHTYEDYPRFISRNKYICNGLEQIKEVNDFFDELKGRNVELWFPSWMKDINIKTNITKDQVLLEIDDIEYSSFYPISHITGNNILIYANKNRTFYRQITDIPDSTHIQIDSALGSIVRLTELKMCSFLYFGRLNLDQIEWEYLTPTVARFMMEFIELPKQTP